jgi:hypothetical protein
MKRAVAGQEKMLWLASMMPVRVAAALILWLASVISRVA